MCVPRDPHSCWSRGSLIDNTVLLDAVHAVIVGAKFLVPQCPFEWLVALNDACHHGSIRFSFVGGECLCGALSC